MGRGPRPFMNAITHQIKTASQNNSPCKNKKFGHNFPYPGAKCLNCGIEQNKVSDRYLKKIGVNPRDNLRKSTIKKNLHSQNHLLADDISKYLNEPKKFAMYLGIICRVGFETANRIFSEIKQSKAKDKTKLFMWKVKNLKLKNRNEK